MNTAKAQKRKKKYLWPILVFGLTFVISFSMSFLSETVLTGVPLPVAVLFLFFLILLGIIFDVLGVAVTSGDVVAYNAMAAKRIRGAREAITLIKYASVISNICNDVIGDICGIISGAMGAAIIASVFATTESGTELIINVLMSATIAAMTVSGKAVGKGIAMRYNKGIVFFAGRIIAFFKPSGAKGRK